MDAIRFEDVGKRYPVGARDASYLTLRETLRGFGRRASRQDFWALQGVDLAVAEGEVMGIIGRNGSGKSTMLKLVARITAPTVGRVRTRGRVGSLLEAGTGFHPELTGRENVFLSAAVLGLGRRETQRRFDEIVAFAGVERFLDTPLKRYSTGMHLRLAFAVAAHADAPLLAVDEILAVGDAEFRRRCLSKLSELGQGDRTVLFVSHDLGAVTGLCTRVVWLDGGRVLADGVPADVVARYTASTAAHDGRLAKELGGGDTAATVLRRVAVVDEAGEPLGTLRRGDPVRVQLDLDVREAVRGFDGAVIVEDAQRLRLIDDTLSDHGDVPVLEPGRHRIVVEIAGVLPVGRYPLIVWLGTQTEDFFYDDVFHIEVLPRPEDRGSQADRRRVVQPPVTWHGTPG